MHTMKKTFLFLALIVVSLSVFSQGIAFEENHNLNDALTKAKQENKLVFIDAYASWCGPCKMMAAKIFPQKEVGDYFNAHFVNLKLDMEKPENLEIAKKYKVQAYPTYLFLNTDGEVVHQALGGMPAEEFIKVAKQAGDTENNAMAIAKKIKNGDRSAETLKKYFEINPYDKDNEKLAMDYLSKLPDNEKCGKDAWQFFSQYVRNPQSEPFQYFLKNRKLFEEKIGKKEADNKIMGMFAYVYQTDKANFENMKSIDPVLFEKTKASLQMNEAYTKFARSKEDKAAWNNLMKVAASYMSSADRKSGELNNLSWMVYENYKKFNDKVSLKNALGWAKRAVDLAPEQSYILDTYAHLLYASGKKKEAVAMANKALELAKKAKDEAGIEAYTKAIEEFKK